MVSRFTSKVLKAISSNRKDERGQRDLHGADLTYLNNFQFNTNSPLQNHLLVQPSVILNENRELRVQLPAFDPLKELKVPPLYSETLIRIVVAALNFKEKYYQYIGYHEVRIEREKKAQEALDWLCPEQLPAGCVTLVSMSLHYNHDSPLTGMVTRNSKELMPSAIIGAFEIEKDEEVAEKKAAEVPEETAGEKAGKHASEFPLYFKGPMNGYRGNEKILDMTRLREKQEAKDMQEKEKGWIVVGKTHWKKMDREK